MIKSKYILISTIMFILFLLSSCQCAYYYQFFFTSSHNTTNNELEKIVTVNTVGINRIVRRQSYTVYPKTYKDKILMSNFLDSIHKNDYLTVQFLTPFEINENFEIRELNVEVFTNALNKVKLQLRSVFISDLAHYYNPYDYQGKNFNDFGPVRVRLGQTSNNVLMNADYDLANIDDSTFIITIDMKLRTRDIDTTINRIDTLFQRSLVSKQVSFRLH